MNTCSQITEKKEEDTGKKTHSDMYLEFKISDLESWRLE